MEFLNYKIYNRYCKIYNRVLKTREYIVYYKRLDDECYRVDDYPHRVNGPAYIKYWPNGKVKYIAYWIRGKRDTNKNITIHDENGNIKCIKTYNPRRITLVKNEY